MPITRMIRRKREAIPTSMSLVQSIVGGILSPVERRKVVIQYFIDLKNLFCVLQVSLLTTSFFKGVREAEHFYS